MTPDEGVIEQLAHWTGELPQELRRWQVLGLLPDEDDDLPIGQRIERVRLIRFAVGRGYEPDRLAEIQATYGDIVGIFAEQIGAMVGEPRYRSEEAALEVGIDPDLLQRLRGAAGLADEPFAADADVEAMRTMKTTLDLGLPVEVLAQMLRVLCDSTNKIADAGSRLFHLHVHEQLRATGTGGEKQLRATNVLSEPLLDLVEPTVAYFNRKAWQRALREDMMLHLAEEETPPSPIPGEFMRAILFADLSGFTPLTEAMGDVQAAQVMARFSEIVRLGAGKCSGQVVKQIGDEFMLVFPNGTAAASCGLSIKEQAAAEPRFPALRIGAHVGSVLYREGDYIGTTANLASRVTAAARRNQFLVTKAVREQLDSLDAAIIPIGKRALKGLSEEVELFELRRESGPLRISDPVCGMELDERTAEAQLSWEGERLLFCSRSCLELFLRYPDRYQRARAP